MICQIKSSARLVTAIVSDASKLSIYEGANIIWAAQYKDEDAPVAIQRSNINGLPGGVVTLGQKGRLNIGYLGSDPFVFKMQPLQAEDLNFNTIQKELQQLDDEIKDAIDVHDMDKLNQQAADNLRLVFTISPTVTHELDTLLLDVTADVAVKELPSATGTLRLKSKIDIADLQIVFSMPAGVRCVQDAHTLMDLKMGSTKEMNLEFYIAELLPVHTTRVNVIASYISTRGIPRVVQQSAYLPLSMFYKQYQPQKTADIKLTYSINTKSIEPRFFTFFPEFISSDNDMQALGLQMLCPAHEHTKEIITVVVAKNSNRIRVQSDFLETFAMILERLVNTTIGCDDARVVIRRDKKKLKKGMLNSRIDSIAAAVFLPIQNILHIIDVHYENQENIRRQSDELDALWLKFKTLQRQLQERSDGEPKENLVLQVEEIYDNLILEGDKLVEMRKDEKKQRCSLNCALSLANWIIMTFNLEERVINIILSVLTIPVEDWFESSWEQCMAPGIEMLHNYGPLNPSKITATNGLIDEPVSQAGFDYSRFRRHFATLFDRIIRLASSKVDMEGNDKMSTNAMKDNGKQQTNDLNNLNHFLELDSKMSIQSRTTLLEAVEDDDEEEYDEEDLSKIGYRKEFGNSQIKSSDSPEWINQDFELPAAEELFSDLGIWW